MARASPQLPCSFNALLRDHLRRRQPIDRERALLLLHTHFGDRVGAMFGRTDQLVGLLDGPRGVPVTEEARRLLERACAVRNGFLAADSEQGPALRRADLTLGAGGGLRAALALPSNGGRLVALVLRGLQPEQASAWVEAGRRTLDVLVLLGPEELELAELLPLLGRPTPRGAPLLCVVPQGRLRAEGCRWFHPATEERLAALLREALDACARLLGVEALQQQRLEIRAIATGGLALANVLRNESDVVPSTVEVEDGLYGELPEILVDRCRCWPDLQLTLDVLPHQFEAAAAVAAAAGPDRLQLRRTRPVDRARKLRYNTVASGRPPVSNLVPEPPS